MALTEVVFITDKNSQSSISLKRQTFYEHLINDIIEICSIEGTRGVVTGRTSMRKIKIVVHCNDCFLGAEGNPAIFISSKTYRLLSIQGQASSEWQPVFTIACNSKALNLSILTFVGILIHETGHAFNVAAGIYNSEANRLYF
ncbi:MAG: hypothetical protein GY750_06120 [Lentisphaerae bacterium]|nr:hypothetical protein [Lentisphaerota bacterium]MCP4100984.1 hypothetical protein [Lentisphaerota bacterium]